MLRKPSGNQTWRAGKGTTLSVIFLLKLSFYRGFSIATSDYQRVPRSCRGRCSQGSHDRCDGVHHA